MTDTFPAGTTASAQIDPGKSGFVTRLVLTGSTLRASTAALAAAGVIGCGSEQASPPTTPTSSTAHEVARKQARKQAQPCPRGTPLITARSLFESLPTGYELGRPATSFAQDRGGQFVRNVVGGNALRRFERAVVSNGGTYGTAVYLMNLNEAADPETVVAAAKQEVGSSAKDVSVGEYPGVLVASSTGKQVIAAAVGRCAAVYLADNNTKRLLTVARSATTGEREILGTRPGTSHR